jgi:DNA polymerase III subunit beta
VSEIDATVEGKPIEIAFNARYLIDALEVMDTAQVSIQTRDASSPGTLKPMGGGDFVHIIMPMHIPR